MGDSKHKVRGFELMEQDDGTVVAKERRRKRRLWIRAGRSAASERANRYGHDAARLGGLLLGIIAIAIACALYKPKPDTRTPLEKLDHVSFAVGDDGAIQVYHNDEKIRDIARTDERYETVKEFLVGYGIPERRSVSALKVVDDADSAARSGAADESKKQRPPAANPRGGTARHGILGLPRQSKERDPGKEPFQPTKRRSFLAP